VIIGLYCLRVGNPSGKTRNIVRQRAGGDRMTAHQMSKGSCTNNFTKLLSHDLVLPAIIQDNVRKLIAEEP
jgi:hypothetical protein